MEGMEHVLAGGRSGREKPLLLAVRCQHPRHVPTSIEKNEFQPTLPFLNPTILNKCENNPMPRKRRRNVVVASKQKTPSNPIANRRHKKLQI